ncbi:MAG: glycosyltransferase [Algicola sp.]|nr:glycosyltransferase [Algicola sp.]
MTQPLVSIIIPTFNRAHLVLETLDSMKAQTYEHWECLVVDDGSTDATSEVLKAYTDKDKRFKYVQRSSDHLKGPNGCRNFGLKQSKGAFIAFCDDDDFWLEHKLETQIAVFHQHPEIALVTCNFEYVEADGERTGRVQSHKRLNHGQVFENMLLKNRTTAITPILKREVFDKVGNFNESIRIFEDWEFYLRVSYYYEFYALDDVLALVRRHPENTSNIVTTEPFEQYQRYKKVIQALKLWGKERFSKQDWVTIRNAEKKRYLKLMRNHCPGFWKKWQLMIKILFANPKEGFYFVSLFFR